MLRQSELKELRKLADQAALRAGAHLQLRIHDELQIERKEGQPTLASALLTEVDVESQDIIFKQLSPTLQTHGIGWLGEESQDNGTRLSQEYFWAVDPLDGTLAFTEKKAGYSVCIALLSNSGSAVIGVIYDPVRNQLYSGLKHHGVFLNHQFIDPASLVESTSGHTWMKSRHLTVLYDISQIQTELFQDQWSLLKAHFLEYGYETVDYCHQGGAAMKAMRMVRAHQQQNNEDFLYYKAPKKSGGGSIWDFAASSVIFKELHFHACNYHNKELWFNDPIDSYMNRQGIIYSNRPALAHELKKLGDHHCIWQE
jgi:fructose-1,6-bisphosphatase/inositol monophosphatase family enzyme